MKYVNKQNSKENNNQNKLFSNFQERNIRNERKGLLM